MSFQDLLTLLMVAAVLALTLEHFFTPGRLNEKFKEFTQGLKAQCLIIHRELEPDYGLTLEQVKTLLRHQASYRLLIHDKLHCILLLLWARFFLYAFVLLTAFQKVANMPHDFIVLPLFTLFLYLISRQISLHIFTKEMKVYLPKKRTRIVNDLRKLLEFGYTATR